MLVQSTQNTISVVWMVMSSPLSTAAWSTPMTSPQIHCTGPETSLSGTQVLLTMSSMNLMQHSSHWPPVVGVQPLLDSSSCDIVKTASSLWCLHSRFMRHGIMFVVHARFIHNANNVFNSGKECTCYDRSCSAAQQLAL